MRYSISARNVPIVIDCTTTSVAAQPYIAIVAATTASSTARSPASSAHHALIRFRSTPL